ncbi:MAG TPA: hypothetical protein PKA90_01485 [Ignavibacteria bacterium]|nr:hypothetical protein [Ignavibacteria bacterium]HMR39078.1 hypothetical protein [Ignavibacteria bacterium]
MKYVRNYSGLKIFTPLVIILFLIIEIYGCNKISQGDQRRKFEYLYKMNNYATLFREYTGILNYEKDFEQYKKRMNKLYMDVDAVKIIPSYEPSTVLKTKFLTSIDDNLMIIQNFEHKPGADTISIQNDTKIRIMNENVAIFLDNLNDEISNVGKE